MIVNSCEKSDPVYTNSDDIKMVRKFCKEH
jgi:hypothetical protein